MIMWMTVLAAQALQPDLSGHGSDYNNRSNVQICQAMLGLQAQLSDELPYVTDGSTRSEGFSVFCNLRRATWDRAISTNLSNFSEGWELRWQHRFSDEICENEAFANMAKQGWTFTQNLTFRGGERFIQDADCGAGR